MDDFLEGILIGHFLGHGHCRGEQDPLDYAPLKSSRKLVSRGRYWINVYNLDSEYIITLSKRESKRAVETVECRDSMEIEVALKLLKDHYSKLGKVTLNTDI